MMDMNGLVHSTAAKPSDAVPSLNFVKKFVDSCLGSEIEIEVLEALRERRIQKPTSEALQLLGHAIHDFGDQLPPLDVNRITLILLNIIRHPDIISSNASVPVQNAGCQSKILGLEMLRLTINALSQLVAQALVKISKENWLFMVKIMRELLETLTNGSELIIEWKYSRLYSGVLQCLQNVLTDFKGPIGDNISGMVTSLLNFLDYGWNSSHLVSLTSQRINEALSDTQGKNVRFTQAVYKPPHLRRGTVDKTSSQKIQNTKDGYNGKDVERRVLLSDSDQSDSDGAVGSQDKFKCSKIRALAVLNIQALARAEPKSLHAYWTLLFPTHDIMNRRRLQTSLLNTLLYDPILKVRMAAAATVSVMLESPSRAFIRMAEFKDAGKTGSFTTLSFSLGQVLVQLQRGLTHLALTETNPGLLVASLKALSLFVGSAPFSRLPEEMLPNIVEALQKRVKSLLSSINDQVNSLCMAINCIGCALNSAPPSVHVAHMLSKDSEIIQEGQLLQDLLVCTEAWVPTPVRVEALQALRFAVRNYQSIRMGFWDFFSPIKHEILKRCIMPSATIDVNCDIYPPVDEKVVHTATKLLNELLRAISGSGCSDDTPDDFLHHLSLESHVSCMLNMPPVAVNQSVPAQETRNMHFELSCWNESLQDILPLLLSHSSALVRAEAMTCFAGMTFSVFCNLSEQQRSYTISTVFEVAKVDESPAVRSTACRAIGVLVNFPTLITRTDILASAMDLIINSTRDASLVVRITASWALANLCDSLRCTSEEKNVELSAGMTFQVVAECAMRLSKDNDKVRANAVRALGNLTRAVNFSTEDTSIYVTTMDCTNPLGKGTLLERVVQALVSCVTTGNVKVQWNVCHALGNLFLNKSIPIHAMPWSTSVYSIMLLLLRDSKNFKIRIQAASALAVPDKRRDYGQSFSDIVQALVLSLESLNSSELADPSTYKYMVALNEQLTDTCLHVLRLVEIQDYEQLQDFLSKKDAFLQSWLRSTSVAASEEIKDGSCQCIENEGTEGTSSNHIARCWIHKERPPRERIWYALNEKDMQVSIERTSLKRIEDVKAVCEKLICMYVQGKQTKQTVAYQELLNRFS